MRKNFSDKKLSLKEKMDLRKHHYEKPDHICDCGCGYHKDTCMKEIQEKYEKEQKEKERIVKINKEHIIDGGSSFDYETK